MFKKESAWIMTDDDSFQIQRQVTDGVYEMYQIQQIKSYSDTLEKGFGIAHSFIFTSEINVQEVLNCYGYSSLDEIKEIYKEDWEKVLVECDFELISGCMENLVEAPDMDWKEAANMIKNLSGYF